MSSNGSSSNSSDSSSSPVTDMCHTSRGISYSFIALCCFYILFFLPLAIFILYLGHQQWRRQRSAAVLVMCNLDLFTYNIIAMEMICLLGHCLAVLAYYFGLLDIRFVMVNVIFAVSLGATWFHVLTCVERYLAVVHPIIYLSLKSTRGIIVRNISIGSAWFLAILWIGVALIYPTFPRVLYSTILVSAVVITSFCSLFVLCSLVHPGPGEVSGAKEQVNQVKKRAFYTILAITGVLWMRFGGSLIYLFVVDKEVVEPWIRCALTIIGMWASLPSSYVLPLLFLHRAGKLLCFKCN